MKVLWIALFRGIGDAVLFYPALEQTSRLFPGAEIKVLAAHTSVADILAACGFKGDIRIWPRNPLKGIALLLTMGIRSCDIVLDASSAQQMHLSRWLSLILSKKVTAGYHYGSSSWLYTKKFSTAPLASWHQKDIYANLLGPWGGDIHPRLCKPPEATDIVFPGLPSTRPRLVVHPGARDDVQAFEKRWPVERYAETLERILSVSGGHAIIVGSGSEYDWIQSAFAAQMKKYSIVNYAGMIPIPSLIEVIRSATLFVGNNSGPMHIAASCGTPLVTFAGGIPLEHWGPVTSGKYAILGLDKRCPSCNHYECLEHGRKCIEAVTVEEVVTAIRCLLGLQDA